LSAGATITSATYREILEFFLQIHDPTTKDRQGNDIGSSYRTRGLTRSIGPQR
jgi:peptide methionine sulfoxide reductase MsrA